jgi:twitching motility protein PilT
MARLDQLISAMLQHGAEALVLEPGHKPSLLMNGSERPIVKSTLTAAHVTQLAAEIAPAEHRPTVAAGGLTSFVYELGGQTIDVEMTEGPKAVIRPRAAASPAPIADEPAATAEAQIAPETAPSPAAAAPVTVDSPLVSPEPPAPTVSEPPEPAAPSVAESPELAAPPVAESPEPAAPPVAESPEPAASPVPVSVEPSEAATPVSRVDPAMVAAAEAESGLSMDSLLRRLVASGGSDLHLSSGSRPMLRVDGELAEIEDVPQPSPAQVEQLLLSITPERNRDEFRSTGDTDFAYEIDGLCRFRSNLFRDRKGAAAVFRVIPSEILTVDDLNLAQSIRDLCFLTKGLVLVTGPTGSGKSTTLCALVDHVNKHRSDHVITIEDPIEFVHENKKCLINQRQVHEHTDGFKQALRAALREDPDVVLVGELRDLETVAIAIETAETGHLVFGTLHTTSAVSTVDRVIDQFPADQQEQIRMMLSESLKAVISQVLCKKVGGGRVAALEVLILNSAVSNLIREGKTFQIPSIMQTSLAQGNVLLNAALLELVQKKIVEPEEAYVKAIDKSNLVSAFEKNGFSTDFLKREEKKEPQPA